MSAETHIHPSGAATAGRAVLPPWPITLAVVLIASVVLLVQVFGQQLEDAYPVIDGAIVNIISLIAGFLAFMVLYIWLSWWSSFSFEVRRVIFWLPLACVALAIALLRYEGVDGYMKPTFAWRWSPRSGEELAARRADDPATQPAGPGAGDPVAPAAATIDLKTETPDDFPQFLGPDRSNYVPAAQLAGEWTTTPPRELWRRDVGPGWAGFSARNGYAVTLEQQGNEEWVTCYAIATGNLVWKHAAPGRHREPLGGLGPRSTPTIDNGRVYAQGATGLLRCLDGATGQLIWQDDLLDRYGLTQATSEEVVKWGRAGSPLIAGDLLIVPASGKGADVQSLIAYYKEDGKLAWEAGTDQISYASPVLGTLCGVQQVVYVSEQQLTGFDVANGKQLWQFDWPGNSTADANVSQALPLDGDRVFVSKGYGSGSAMLQITRAGDKFTAEPLWESRRILKTKFTNVTVIDGHAYGLSDGVLECADLETGKSKWRGGRYGHGQLLGAGDKLLVLGEDGDLMLVAASPERFQQLGKLEALSGKTWNNLCLTGKRLLIRNGQQAVCYELP